MALVLGACWGGDGNDDTASEPHAGAGIDRDAAFAIRLSPGEAVGAEVAEVDLVEGDELDADRVEEIIDRLTAFTGDEEDVADFRFPPEPFPRPRVGQTLEVPVGGEAGNAGEPPADTTGPLEVLRHQPDGEVDVAPFLSVTFNQPMVPVGTLDQLDQSDVPIEVTPALEGRWRWIGTRTLRFEHSDPSVDRLPAATEFTVTVPAGTASANGDNLSEAFTWTFATPAPTVRSVVPSRDSIDIDPVFVITFDQRVDPDAVLDQLHLVADDEAHPFRRATDDEIAADDDAREAVASALEGRWVAFRPSEPLPKGVQVRVVVGAGTPSAEGPRTTPERATSRARTYEPLDIDRTDCGFGNGCHAGDSFVITFNNQLDPASISVRDIVIEPEVGATIGVHGDAIAIHSTDTSAGTTYEVTVPAALADVFGQALGDDRTVSFDVGDARPVIESFRGHLISADPYADAPSLLVNSAGHEQLKVSTYSVTPDDYATYRSYVEQRNSDTLEGLPAWTRTSSQNVDVAGGGKSSTETAIDLRPALGDRPGHVVVTVESVQDFPQESEEYWQNRPTIVWVQRTDIGIDAVSDNGRLVAWTTDLSDGTPMPGVSVSLAGVGSGTTGPDGVASIALAGATRHLVATAGDDSAILDSQFGPWQSQALGDSPRWYVIDDRHLYRPGETVKLKGWVRRLRTSTDATIIPVGGAPSVPYTAHDSFGNELAKGTAEVTSTGGFDASFDIPDAAMTGPAYVQLTLDGVPGLSGGHTHQFRIDEFRRPDFEVVTQADSAEPHILTSPVTVSALARYFAGGVLPDAAVTWRVDHRTTTYSPPNRSTFSFGVERPFWLAGDDMGFGSDFSGDSFGRGPIDPSCCFDPADETEQNTYRSRTDSTGTDRLRLDFEGDVPDEPITVSANAAVEDVNRQQFGSTVDLLVHPAERYVGLRTDRSFFRRGDSLDVEAIVTDIDGAAIAGVDLTVTAARITEEYVDGEWTEVDVDEQTCEVSSEDEAVECSFATDVGGQYRIRSVVEDDAGGRNRTEITRWVSGADAVPSRSVEEETATIVPDAESYAPGDTAELLVIAPFSPARGLLTVSRAGMETTKTFEITDGATVLELPITDASIPGLSVRVDLAGSTPRRADDGTDIEGLPARPAYAGGTIQLPVTPASRTLQVEATPADRALAPGETTTVKVAVADAAGDAVADAEVAVIVVDEAVLSLAGYELPDPIATIYGPLDSFVRSDRSRAGLQLSDPETFGVTPDTDSTISPDEFQETGMAMDGAELAGGSGSSSSGFAADAAAPAAQRSMGGTASAVASTPIGERSDFDALAVFAPALPTDAAGTASVEVTVPDNLTRYRVMAVAADAGNRFGSGESTITARLPLQVRPSAPRFMNFGDRAELPIVVQNQTDEPLVTEVVLETSGMTIDGPAGRAVAVPAGERVEVRFPVTADHAGTARFRATAVSGDLADSASGELPVYTPATTEAFATYGVVDDGAIAQPLLAPEGVIEGFGGLEVDTSSTAVQALTDAVVYLADYHYDSADAHASRIIALVSLRDVFAAFATADAPTPAQLDATIRSDIEALARLQNDDGGFPSWQRGRPSEPYTSVQAAHAVIEARAAGYPVSIELWARALDHMRTIEDRIPADWSESARHTISAYALHVRAVAGEADPAKAEALYRSDDELGLDALAWLWPVVGDPSIVSAIERTFQDRVTETPQSATFTTGYDETTAALLLASDRRTDGIVLDALINRTPDSDLVPKVVNGLLANQVKGRWTNVQENGFILLAMQHYFETFEAATPDFVARTWLGDTYAAGHEHRGRSIDTTRSVIPTAELVERGDTDLTIAKDGGGRLYYRIGLRYAPADLRADGRDEGFVVERTYEGVDDPDDVRRNDDGSWTIRPGAAVRVRLTMVADSRRTNMALVDNLPAGLEPVNPALAASPRQPNDEGGDGGDGGDRIAWPGWFTWFDHQSLRDSRAMAFASWLEAGTYEFTYVARATTPGTYVAPPAKAEEIYAPEVFGRSASDAVVVGTP